jgi:peptide/nickel transport system substrate-binding protein
MTLALRNRLGFRHWTTLFVAGAFVLCAAGGGAAQGKPDPVAERRVPALSFLNDPEGYSAAFWEASNLLLQTWKKELGVTFKREVADHEVLISRYFAGDYDAGIVFILGDPTRLDPGFLLNALFKATGQNCHPKSPAAKCPGGTGALNFSGYFNPEFNRLLEQQNRAYAHKERKAITDKMLEMLAEDRPALVLLSPNVTHLMNTRRWKNEKHVPGEGLSSFWNVMEIEPTGSNRTLRIGSTYEVPGVNPMAVTRTQGYRPMGLIYDTLYRIDPEGRAIKWMVEDAQVKDGPQGPRSTVVLRLRKDLKFHDGVPVTAADVAYTIDFAKKHKAPDLLPYVRRVAEVAVEGQHTIRIGFTGPWSGAFHVLFSKMFILPKHVWEKEEQRQENPVLWANPQPVGSGPFRFVSWEKGSELVLQRNPEYFHPAKPERLVRVRFDTMELLASAIEQGEIDIQWEDPIPAPIAERLRGQKDVKVVNLANHGFLAATVNVTRPPFNDPAFMKALDLTIPRDLIIERVYKGVAAPAVSPIPAGNAVWHNPRVARLTGKFDPDQARQVLQQAGYEWDGEGNLLFPR